MRFSPSMLLSARRARALALGKGRGGLRAVALCLGLLTAVPALAQETPPAEAPKAEAPAEPAPAPTPAPEPAPAEKPADKPAAEPDKPAEAAKDTPKVPDVGGVDDTDLYGIAEESVPAGGRLEWAKRREIQVIQKRAVLKEGRHGFSLFGGVVPNDDFFVYLTTGVGYSYYFSEDLALNVQGAYTYDQQTSLEKQLTDGRPDGFSLGVRLPQTLKGYATAGVDWNLVHGKLGFFTTRLGEFDLALSFGLGGVMTKVTPQNKASYTLPAPAGNLGAYLQFYLSDNWALRMDYHQVFYPAYKDEGGNEWSGGVSYPIATTLALTYFTDALQ